MNQAKTIEFKGEQYFDDRLFILYLCKGKVEVEPDSDGIIWTTIYHEQAPEDHLWCVVTYRNCSRFPGVRVDSFYNKDDAMEYLKKIEPETPLISLDGKSPPHPISYEAYLVWKKENNLKDYDWKSLYLLGGSNAEESIGQTKEQFGGVK